MFIRQNATHKVVIGPVVAVGDGFTPVTTLSVSTADEAEAILHDNGTVVDISGYTFAAITTADGYYHLTLQSGISGSVGHLTIVINDDSLCLPVKAQFTIVEEAVYDALYAGGATGLLPANVTQIGGDAQSATDLKDFADAGYDPATNKVQGVVLVDTNSDLISAATIASQVRTELATELARVDGSILSRSSHSAADVWAVATRVLTAGTNLNNLSTADIDARLAAYDGPTNAEMVAAFTQIKGATWSSFTDTLEAITNNITLGNGYALNAQISSAATQALANGASGFVAIDTVVDAIKAKTDNLPASPASTTNITAGTITTVTNLTNAPTAGDLTSTMKASVTAAVPTAVQIASQVLTTVLADAYAAHGNAPTLQQAIMWIHQHLDDSSISGATKTVKKIDGTNAGTLTLTPDGTTPTAISRAT